MLINFTFVLYFLCLKILSTEEVSEAGDKYKKNEETENRKPDCR